MANIKEMHKEHGRHPSSEAHHKAKHEMHMHSRFRDEGEHLRHARPDGGVPVMGPEARRIHGAHSGESGAVMTTPVQDRAPSAKTGKPGEHEEER